MRYLGAESFRLRAVLARRRVQPSSYTTERSLNSCVPSPEHWFARRAMRDNIALKDLLGKKRLKAVREQLP
jgi:hypothetical protein